MHACLTILTLDAPRFAKLSQFKGIEEYFESVICTNRLYVPSTFVEACGIVHPRSVSRTCRQLLPKRHGPLILLYSPNSKERSKLVENYMEHITVVDVRVFCSLFMTNLTILPTKIFKVVPDHFFHTRQRTSTVPSLDEFNGLANFVQNYSRGMTGTAEHVFSCSFMAGVLICQAKFFVMHFGPQPLRNREKLSFTTPSTSKDHTIL